VPGLPVERPDIRRLGDGHDPEGAVMFERYTDRARRSVVLAQEQARMLHHPVIDTDHMLLGLAAEGEAIAFQALAAAGQNLPGLRTAVEERRPPGRLAPAGHLPFTRDLKRALELGLRESLYLGHNFIGTEHLLLGLMKDCENRAGSPSGAVLAMCGTTPQEVREQVMILLRGYGDVPAEPEPSAAPPGMQAIADGLDEIIRLAQAMRKDLGLQ
jgi:ATP-dependent Clp protease ATP-binding subunit ClpC